jgi:2'-5' RNA ligase
MEFAGMMRSVELTLTDTSDTAFRVVWAALDEAGLASSGRSASPTNRPHITLVAGASLALPTWPASLVPPPSVVLGGLTLFPAGRGRSVLVRAVVVDEALAAFHRAVHELVPGGVPTSLPGHWSPHITLARRLTPPEVGTAVSVVAALPELASASVGGVRFWSGDDRTVTPLA